MEVTWHNQTKQFDSVKELKLKAFQSSLTVFQVGYLEGRASTKRWIFKVEDVNKNYEG